MTSISHDVLKGSSPRVRGEAAASEDVARAIGIIPAGAGRRRLDILGCLRWRDHPRGCGEKVCYLGSVEPLRGSSPRVRGEVSLPPWRGGGRGIIPAGAGRSQNRFAALRRIRDHPRGCGEKMACVARSEMEQGSSPRVRGEGDEGLGDLCGDGIIPAGAGRRGPTSPIWRWGWDHPRGCGEKSAMDRHLGRTRGSSPRVRGEVVKGPRRDALGGIIPAGAGRRRRD